MKRYCAFISYKHVTSRDFAENLELSIKRYAKPPWRLPVSIFRDEKYLQASSSLSAEIKKALRSSDYLIYLASPEAAESQWVKDELLEWCSDRGRAKRLILVLTDGSIAIDSQAKEIDWTKTTSLPKVLKEYLTGDPLFVDLSWARSAQQQSLLNPEYRKAINLIVATMRGVGPIAMSDIAITEYRKGVRFRNGFVSAVILLAIGMAGAAFVAWSQKLTAERNSREATARSLASESELTVRQRGALLDRAVLLALQSTRLSPSVEGNAALRHSLALLPERSANLDRGSGQVAVTFSPDGHELAVRSRSMNDDPDPSEDRGLNVIAPEGCVLIARLLHDGRVTNALFDPSGRYLATVSEDGTARVWAAPSWQELARYQHGGPVYGVAFSPDGRLVASSGLDSGIALWNWRAKELVRRLPAEEPFDMAKAKLVEFGGDWVYRMPQPGVFRVIRFSEDGNLLAATGGAVANGDEDIFVWSVDSGEKILQVNHSDPVEGGLPESAHRSVSDTDSNYVNDLVFSRDGRKLISAGFDGTIRVWSLASGKLVTHMLHDDSINRLDLSPSGKLLASASNDQTARTWELETGRELHRFRHEDAVDDVRFDPAGRYLGTASHDHTARLWSTGTGEEVARVVHGHVVEALAFDSGGRFLATASIDDSASVWDLDSLNKIHWQRGHNSRITLSGDRERVVTIEEDKALSVWNSGTGEAIRRLATEGIVRDLALSANGNRLAARVEADEEQARVWGRSTGEMVARFPAADALGLGMALSPDGSVLAVTSGDRDVVLWSVAKGSLVRRFTHQGRAVCLAFSPDGRYLAVATVGPGHEAYVWEVETNAVIARLDHQGSVLEVVFSPDGTLLATASEDKTAAVWTVPQGERLFSIKHGGWVRAVTFSNDGRYVATGGEDGVAQVWDVERGAAVLQVHHDREVNAVAFDPRGRFIATASNDFSARVWNIQTGDEMARIAHPAGVADVMFDADGRHLITETRERSVQSWMWEDASLKREACSRVFRELTPDEQQQFLPNREWRASCFRR